MMQFCDHGAHAGDPIVVDSSSSSSSSSSDDDDDEAAAGGGGGAADFNAAPPAYDEMADATPVLSPPSSWNDYNKVRAVAILHDSKNREAKLAMANYLAGLCPDPPSGAFCYLLPGDGVRLGRTGCDRIPELDDMTLSQHMRKLKAAKSRAQLLWVVDGVSMPVSGTRVLDSASREGVRHLKSIFQHLLDGFSGSFVYDMMRSEGATSGMAQRGCNVLSGGVDCKVIMCFDPYQKFTVTVTT
jgi:hypothetical protein